MLKVRMVCTFLGFFDKNWVYESICDDKYDIDTYVNSTEPLTIAQNHVRDACRREKNDQDGLESPKIFALGILNSSEVDSLHVLDFILELYLSCYQALQANPLEKFD